MEGLSLSHKGFLFLLRLGLLPGVMDYQCVPSFVYINGPMAVETLQST